MSAVALTAILAGGPRPPIREVEVDLAERNLTLSKLHGGRTLHLAPHRFGPVDVLCGAGYAYWRGGAEVNYRPETPFCRKCVRAAARCRSTADARSPNQGGEP